MLALLVLVTALPQAAAKLDPPPVPDFKTKVDYAAWLEKQLTAGMREGDNAAPLYRKMIGEFTATEDASAALGFSGPKSDKDAKWDGGPWNPADHAAWEKSYARTTDLIDDFLQASAKSHAFFGLSYDESTPEATRTLIDVRVGPLSYFRALAKGASDHAWRAPAGKVDGDRFVALMAANAGLTRQIDREPMAISQLIGYALRSLICDDFSLALDRDILTATQRRKCLDILRSPSFEPRPFRTIANAELAVFYDVTQMLAKRGPVRGAAMATAPADPAATCSSVAEFYKKLTARSEQPWTPSIENDIEALKNDLKAKRNEEIVKMLIPNLGRAIVLRFRTEALCRGTRLLYELSAFHDKNNAWPDSLDKLPGVPAAAKTDPFSGKPFIYKRDDDAFTLYSVGINTRDDGGKHDPKFGEKTGDGDYVFWPVQKDR